MGQSPLPSLSAGFPNTVATPCCNPLDFPVVLQVVGAWPWAKKLDEGQGGGPCRVMGAGGRVAGTPQTFLSHFGKLPQDLGLDGEGWASVMLCWVQTAPSCHLKSSLLLPVCLAPGPVSAGPLSLWTHHICWAVVLGCGFSPNCRALSLEEGVSLGTDPDLPDPDLGVLLGLLPSVLDAG